VSPSVFDPQLESIAVARTGLSRIDGESGELVVRGYPIEDLAANATYAEALFLLLHDRLPTAGELEGLRRALTARPRLDPSVTALVERAAETGVHPLTALRMGLAASTLDTGASGDEGDAVQGNGSDGSPAASGESPPSPVDTTARRLVASVPTILGTYWQASRDVDPLPSREGRGYAANYLAVLGVDPEPAAVDALETFLVTALEHGLNTSTFAARTAVSTGADVGAGVTAAVCTFEGPRHGGVLDEVDALLRRVATTGDAGAVVRDLVGGDDPIPGFGHPVYRVRDPRVAVLESAAEDCWPDGGPPLAAAARELEATVGDMVADGEIEGPVHPTLDLAAVPLLDSVGLPPALFAPTFAAARIGGWVAHCREQQTAEHLLRPGSRYVGRTDESWQPLDRRWAVGGEGVDGDSLSGLSETLGVLAEPSRLEILLALAEADGPRSYSALREATGFEDKGRFNYHLRQLRDGFVADGETGYSLTGAGRAVVETVLTEERLQDVG
jgi:citrate synthase